jgi:flagellar biogenesis protein FliO
VLAVCGGVAAAIGRIRPGVASRDVQVVGRVSLSPKHAVYVLRVGRRRLLVGAGAQSAPVLIAELSDSGDTELDQGQEDSS